MKILEVAEEAYFSINFRGVGRDYRPCDQVLELRAVRVEQLPDELEALILTSDLQGREQDPVTNRLLGEAVAEELVALCDLELLPKASKTAVILAGDLYVGEALDRRGGMGDVRPVWEAFKEEFRWVAGVAGNHDSFGRTTTEEQEFFDDDSHAYLDGTWVCKDSITVSGVSGVIGRETKRRRKSEENFGKRLKACLDSPGELLVLHEGPDFPEKGYLGQKSIRESLLSHNRRVEDIVVIFGHCRWPEAFERLGQSLQVLNVDERCLVLVEQEWYERLERAVL